MRSGDALDAAFKNPQGGRSAAREMYEDGADVIFQAAGGSGIGVFEAATERSRPGRHLWAIGVDTDQFVTVGSLPGVVDPEPWRNHILTSVLKRIDMGIYAVLEEYARGVFIPGNREFGLATDGVGLSYSGGFIDSIRPRIEVVQGGDRRWADRRAMYPAWQALESTRDGLRRRRLSRLIGEGVAEPSSGMTTRASLERTRGRLRAMGRTVSSARHPNQRPAWPTIGGMCPMKHLKLAALASLVLLIGLSGSALASPPEPVTITVTTTIEGADDPFAATGGLVCDAGTVTNGGGNFIGWQSGTHAQIILKKVFTCPDGTFVVLLRVTLNFETRDTAGTWSVLDGTGAYATLRGAGSLTGDNTGGDSILDVYVGHVHLD